MANIEDIVDIEDIEDIEEISIEGKTKYSYQDVILCKLKPRVSTVKDFHQETISMIQVQ